MSRTILDVFVPGIPKSKNERRAFVVGGRAVMTAHPKQQDAQRALSAVLVENFRGLPADGPVRVSFEFVFPIAKSWPKARKARALKGVELHTGRPDLSRLVAHVEDAMSGVVFLDDCQIAGYGPTGKRYGERPGTRIVVEALEVAHG